MVFEHGFLFDDRLLPVVAGDGATDGDAFTLPAPRRTECIVLGFPLMPVAGFPLASPALGTAAEFALVAGLLAPGVELVGGVGETEGVVLWLWFGLVDRIGGAVDA